MNCIKAIYVPGRTSLVLCGTSNARVNPKVVCRQCQAGWTDDKPPDRVCDNLYLTRLFACGPGIETLPTFTEMVSSFASAMLVWARRGFGLVCEEIFNKRVKICASCQHFNKPAPGVCGLCRCGSVKLHLKTTRCDIGKWESEV